MGAAQRPRFVTAASLFDGHDASINIIRRLLQSKGAEVVHLGHNRSAREVADAAVQEDAHAVAVSSYQGGHNEYFPYLRGLLDEAGAADVRVFGGGGGVIVPAEIRALEAQGASKIYSPEDGAALGLPGIIDDMLERARFDTTAGFRFDPARGDDLHVARVVTVIEDTGVAPFGVPAAERPAPALGITGTGGAGKSSLIDELLLRFRRRCPGSRAALLSVDPTRRRTGGALLGDRIRLGAASGDGAVFARSLATRGSPTELSPNLARSLAYVRSLDFGLVLVETSGIGQSGDAVAGLADKCVYVMTPEYGAQTQLEKIGMLERADFVVINKFDKPGGEEALRDVRRQVRRDRGLPAADVPDDALPVFATRAGRFNDPGVNDLFDEAARALGLPGGGPDEAAAPRARAPAERPSLIPPGRAGHLREAARAVRDHDRATGEGARLLGDWEAVRRAADVLGDPSLAERAREMEGALPAGVLGTLRALDGDVAELAGGECAFEVRGREVRAPAFHETLSGSRVPRVAAPRLESAADRYRFARGENLPGRFPFAQGVFRLKRGDEEPRRMFAGAGSPSRTNERFHLLSKGDRAKRLSTAFDSITLYGEDPDERPDVFGKIGESGVSVATIDDMEELYRGFDLTDPGTSVSMTINGPAPMILAMFFSAALRQKLSGGGYWDEDRRTEVLRRVRGTIQADILKEDQAQNTCIFSLEFALRMMGDMQEYLCRRGIRNYYSVSISGYHIAEAGANPITQAAFTLANGLTYVEYYLSRGMAVDDFAGNLSFFFSNGLDPEYAVIGRAARKIWAVAMRDLYGAGEAAQRLKYHVQTSGRSLHAQEMSFNDVRTTLQAFLALADNCNSLHTNAYDEAVTTPTEESVRRAVAIQMILDREFGPTRTDNPLQGSFLVAELTEIVQEAVLREFERISDKGGVLGAMEGAYQRGRIQDESLRYESLKDSGELPVVGVNTFLPPGGAAGGAGAERETELSRCPAEEKRARIAALRAFHARHADEAPGALRRLGEAALSGGNVFEELLRCANVCSLGQMTRALYEVGGRYRRNV